MYFSACLFYMAGLTVGPDRLRFGIQGQLRPGSNIGWVASAIEGVYYIKCVYSPHRFHL